jgi:predicted MFS family arabinose efflux permease
MTRSATHILSHGADLGARARNGLLSPTATFYLQASITLSFLAASSAPTPLYPLYQAAWGLSAVAVTVAFGIYAIAVLAALLVGGRLSDHIGRRPVLLGAIVAQAAAVLVLAGADGLFDLLTARVVQGLSAGAALAAVGAGLIDLDRARGTVANAVMPPLGTATGALAAGLMVHYLPAPTHLVYLVLFAVLVLQGIGVAFMVETVTRRPGALASLRPQFALPGAARRPMLLAVPILVAVWALGGFYASLGPSLVRSVFGWNASLGGGITLFILAGSGAAAVFLLQRRSGDLMMTFGAVGILAGVAVMLAAVSHPAPSAFLAGAVLAGAGFGAGFQGAVRTVVPFASPQERAGVLAMVFVVAYLAMGVPAVVAGFLVAGGGSVVSIAREFGGVVIALALIALVAPALKRQP